MKKFIICACITLVMTGCATTKEVFSETAFVVKDTLSRQTNQQAQPSDRELITHLKTQTKGKTPAPNGQPNGVFSTTDSQGRTLKTVVKDGFFDQYVDVYYPNGQKQSHTPLVGGVPHGWSVGYHTTGTTMSRMLYQHGKIIKAERYDHAGKLIKTLDVQ